MIKLGELVMILDLHSQGLSVSAIARQVGVDRKTVRPYIAKGLEPPAYKKRAAAPSLVDRFEPYLRERLAGCRAGGSCRATDPQCLPQRSAAASLPAPRHRPADADPLGNLQHRQALGGQQDDLRPLNVLHQAPSVLDDPLQIRVMLSREEKRDSPSHSTRTVLRLCESSVRVSALAAFERAGRNCCRSGFGRILCRKGAIYAATGSFVASVA